MSLFNLFRGQPAQAPTEANRVHNFENALREVRRWNQAKRIRAEDGAELDRLMDQQINELIQAWGADSVVVQSVQEARQDYQHQNELSLQDAERRLVCYQNIILKQGRM